MGVGARNEMSWLGCLWGSAGFVGEQHADKNDDEKYTIYTHKDLLIKYNNDQV